MARCNIELSTKSAATYLRGPQEWVDECHRRCMRVDESLYEHSPDYIPRSASTASDTSPPPSPAGGPSGADTSAAAEPEMLSEASRGLSLSTLTRIASRRASLPSSGGSSEEVEVPLTSVFTGIKVYLDPEHHKYSKLFRYLVAFGAETVYVRTLAQLIVAGEGFEPQEGDPTVVDGMWVWDCINCKKLLRTGPYEIHRGVESEGEEAEEDEEDE
eukprot:TRINITY_DN3867_c0_g1_i1.p2 TRINITY_DN3867_c0_g1~~TRINITY_DN3867_c0_g1_i1.p2  ORF type:complete len:215 (+),score=60.84 TRINITY_DN3867_c0_g1_i1:73-717(+)